MMSDAAAKPACVLLSILKSARVEQQHEKRFTAITVAGYGRFESDQVLIGVELMNLSVSANIEISVQRKDRRTGHEQPLFHGLVPLAAVNSFFHQGSGKPQVWEKWFGLFNAGVSLKDQSPVKVFQSRAGCESFFTSSPTIVLSDHVLRRCCRAGRHRSETYAALF